YSIDLDKIVKIVEYLTLPEQIKALEFFNIIVKNEKVNFNTTKLRIIIKQKKIKYYLKSNPFKGNFLNFISTVITYNIVTLSISIIAIFSIYCLILAPASS